MTVRAIFLRATVGVPMAGVRRLVATATSLVMVLGAGGCSGSASSGSQLPPGGGTEPTGPAIAVTVSGPGPALGQDQGEPIYELARMRGIRPEMVDGSQPTYSLVLLGTRDELGRPDRIAQAILWETDPLQATRVWFDGDLRPVLVTRQGSEEMVSLSWTFDDEVELRLISGTSVLHRSRVTRTASGGWTAMALAPDVPAAGAAAPVTARAAFTGPPTALLDQILDPVGGAKTGATTAGDQLTKCAAQALEVLGARLARRLGVRAWFLRGVRDGVRDALPALALFAIPGGQAVSVAVIGASIAAWTTIHVIDGAVSDLALAKTARQPIFGACHLEDLPQVQDAEVPPAEVDRPVDAQEPSQVHWLRLDVTPRRLLLDEEAGTATLSAATYRYLIDPLPGFYRWESEDPAVASVGGCGCTDTVDITPHGAGETFVTVRDETYGVTATIRVKVRRVIDRLVVTGAPDRLAVGARTQVSVTALDAQGRATPWPEGQFRWSAAPGGSLEVTSLEPSSQVGLKGLVAGTAVVTVTEAATALAAQATVQVEVSGDPVALAFVPSRVDLWPGMALEVRVVATWPDGHTQDVTSNAGLISSNPEAAVVESPTMVRGVTRGAGGVLQASLGSLRASAAVTVAGPRLLAVQSWIPKRYWDTYWQQLMDGGIPITRIMDVDTGAQVGTMGEGHPSYACNDFSLAAFAPRTGRLIEFCKINQVAMHVRQIDVATLARVKDYEIFGDGVTADLSQVDRVVLDEVSGLAYMASGSLNQEVLVWDYAEDSVVVVPMGLSFRQAAFDDVSGKLLGIDHQARGRLHRLPIRTFAIEATAAVDVTQFVIDPAARRIAAVGDGADSSSVHELDLDSLEVRATIPLTSMCGTPGGWLKVDRKAGRWYLANNCEIQVYDWGAVTPRARLSPPGRIKLDHVAVSEAQRRIFAYGPELYDMPGPIVGTREQPFVFVWDADALTYLGAFLVPGGLLSFMPLP